MKWWVRSRWVGGLIALAIISQNDDKKSMALHVMQPGTPGGCCPTPSAPAPRAAAGSPGRTAALLAGALGLWIAAYAAIQPLSEWITFRLLGLGEATRLGRSVAFFLYDAPKVLLLLALVVFVVGVVQSYF